MEINQDSLKLRSQKVYIGASNGYLKLPAPRNF